MPELYVIATIAGRPDAAAELRDLLTAALPGFRAEDGCIAYRLLEDRARPGTFMTYEVWRDDAALKAHLSSPAMAQAGPKMKALLAQDITIRKLDLVG